MERRWWADGWSILLSAVLALLLACLLLYQGITVLMDSACVTLRGRDGQSACVSSTVVGPALLVASVVGFLVSVVLGRFYRAWCRTTSDRSDRDLR